MRICAVFTRQDLFGERFIQGAAALVDRSRRMDGDAVRTGRFDIKNFMDWYE